MQHVQLSVRSATRILCHKQGQTARRDATVVVAGADPGPWTPPLLATEEHQINASPLLYFVAQLWFRSQSGPRRLLEPEPQSWIPLLVCGDNNKKIRLAIRYFVEQQLIFLRPVCISHLSRDKTVAFLHKSIHRQQHLFKENSIRMMQRSCEGV